MVGGTGALVHGIYPRNILHYSNQLSLDYI